MVHKKQKENPQVFLAGLSLILLVFLVTFFRYHQTNQASEHQTSLDQQNLANQIDSKLKISSEDLLNRIQTKKDITVIDIRDENSFAVEHIIGAQNIPGSSLENNLASLDKNKAYALIDDMGYSAPALADMLTKKYGFREIYYVSGGFNLWKGNFNPTISDGDPMSITDQAKVKYISLDDLKNQIDNNPALYILDVRKETSFKEGHIKGAVNIFLGDLEKRKNEIPLGKTIVVYDNDGLWAFKAAVKLFDMGIFNVKALPDGLDAWKQKGYEVRTTD